MKPFIAQLCCLVASVAFSIAGTTVADAQDSARNAITASGMAAPKESLTEPRMDEFVV